MHQLCYTSKFKPTRLDVLKEMHEISQRSRIYTVQHNITGILCFEDGQLFECLEGVKADLLILMQRIESDDRHAHIQYLAMKKINGRRFNDWNIHFISKRSPMYPSFLQYGFAQMTVDQMDSFLDVLMSVSLKKSPS